MVYRVQQTEYFDDTAHRGARPPLDGDSKAVALELPGLVKGWYAGLPFCDGERTRPNSQS